MITAISNFKELNSVKQTANYNLQNIANSQNHLISKVNSIEQPKMVSFTGTPLSFVSRKGNFTKLFGSMISGKCIEYVAKIKRFTTEATSSIRVIARKFNKQNMIPFSEKPVICELKSTDTTQKILVKNAKESPTIKARKKSNEDLITNNGGSVEKGDLDENGRLTSAGKSKTKKPSFEGNNEDVQNNDLNNSDGISDFKKNSGVNESNYLGSDNLDDGINDIDNSNWSSLNSVSSDSTRVLDVNGIDNFDNLCFKDPDIELQNFGHNYNDFDLDSDIGLDTNLDFGFNHNIDIELPSSIDVPDLDPPIIDIPDFT